MTLEEAIKSEKEIVTKNRKTQYFYEKILQFGMTVGKE